MSQSSNRNVLDLNNLICQRIHILFCVCWFKKCPHYERVQSSMGPRKLSSVECLWDQTSCNVIWPRRLLYSTRLVNKRWSSTQHTYNNQIHWLNPGWRLLVTFKRSTATHILEARICSFNSLAACGSNDTNHATRYFSYSNECKTEIDDETPDLFHIFGWKSK